MQQLHHPSLVAAGAAAASGSQFQPPGFYPQEPLYAYPSTMPPPGPPPSGPPPPIPGTEMSATSPPSNISHYGTLPRGPPRPVLPIPEVFMMPHEHSQPDQSAIQQQQHTGASSSSTTPGASRRSVTLNPRGLINYATFRQKLSEESAFKAQLRAEANAEAARHWNQEQEQLAELNSMQQQGEEKPDLNGEDAEDEASTSSVGGDDSTSMSSSSTEPEVSHCQPPSPPPRRDRSASRQPPVPALRPRSASPGKTVTFSDETTAEDERSLNELDATPRRLKLAAKKPLAALANLGTSLKRRAPSPPPMKVKEPPREHEALGARLSASLRATFGLPQHHNAYVEERGSEKSEKDD